MGQIEYIYQCVVQALAMEEENVVPRSVRQANLRYIKMQMAKIVSASVRDNAEKKAADLIEAIKARK